ncbi:hypothetical protein GCM10009087_53330 [Sphingomonas oligophenolica]
MGVERGGQPHCRSFEPIALIMRRNAAQCGVDKRAIERRQRRAGRCGESFPQGCGNPPDQPVMKLGREIGPARRRIGFASPAALGGNQRHRRCTDHGIGMLDQAREHAGTVDVLGCLDRQSPDQYILANASKQLTHQFGIPNKPG